MSRKTLFFIIVPIHFALTIGLLLLTYIGSNPTSDGGNVVVNGSTRMVLILSHATLFPIIWPLGELSKLATAHLGWLPFILNSALCGWFLSFAIDHVRPA